MSARPFLQELAERTDAHAARTGRRCHLIAESDLNDSRVIRPRTSLGFGIPVQWSDDFHHALHTLLTGEDDGYYADFGTIDDLVTALRDGFVYAGRYSAFRRRSHGNRSKDLPFEQFVHFSQNHDQVGNRLAGERLTGLVDFEALKLAAAAVLLAPQIPMLWMGEEYGEPAPFLYFVSHGDPDLVEAVRKGRAEEFSSFHWDREPPDPQAVETFEKSRLDWSLREKGKHAVLLSFYEKLITLRKNMAPLQDREKTNVAVTGDESTRTVVIRRRQADDEAFYVLNMNHEPVTIEPPLQEGRWLKLLDSAGENWSGPGAEASDQMSAGDEITMQPWSVVFYRKEAVA
jgi:maltooligosyltrehalose trehalohydrolase